MMVAASPNRHPTATSAAADPRGPAPFPLRLICSMTKMGSVPKVERLAAPAPLWQASTAAWTLLRPGCDGARMRPVTGHTRQPSSHVKSPEMSHSVSCCHDMVQSGGHAQLLGDAYCSSHLLGAQEACDASHGPQRKGKAALQPEQRHQGRKRCICERRSVDAGSLMRRPRAQGIRQQDSGKCCWKVHGKCQDGPPEPSYGSACKTQHCVIAATRLAC